MEAVARKPIPVELEKVATAIIDAAFKVHIALGPGLLESAYERCLAFELERRGHVVQRQFELPIHYDGFTLDVGYRLDLLVDDVIVVEVKSVDTLIPIHQSQLLTYLKLSGRRLGFLMNFNVRLLKDGLRRVAL
jgi:GxxExxY protein